MAGGKGLLGPGVTKLALAEGARMVIGWYSPEEWEEAQTLIPDEDKGKSISVNVDATGRIFGLMPHPEAFNHYTNHPDWVLKREELARAGKRIEKEEGEGIAIFRNAVQYVRENL